MEWQVVAALVDGERVEEARQRLCRGWGGLDFRDGQKSVN